MAVINQTTDAFSPVNPFVSNGDTFVLKQGVLISPINGTAAISSALAGNLNIYGDVSSAANSALFIGTSGQTSSVTIANTSTISGGANSYAIFVDGTHHILNAGLISNESSFGGGIGTIGAGDIINSGEIHTSYIGITSGDFALTDTVALFNSGIIETSGSLVYSGNSSIDTITNIGTMKGNVSTNGGDDALYNFGHVYGNVDMGAGNDTLYTHLSDVGPYTITGGAGSDTLVNLDTFGTDSVNLSAMSFESYYGQGANDYVWAGASTLDTVFVGGAGNDAFVGGSGNDYVVGGVGADYLDGGAGFNSLGYAGSAQGVTVNLFTGTGSGGDATGDSFFNFQGVVGSDNADILYGNNGVNYLSGGAGNDLLVGYGGNDVLTGGAGNDIFDYTATGYGHDEITDFTIGQDVIYVSTSIAANFAGLNLTQVGANTLITTGADSIQLDNITVANLHASDFVFF